MTDHLKQKKLLAHVTRALAASFLIATWVATESNSVLDKGLFALGLY
jgi:hypothetical protein